jgi:hypothetical protein
MKPTVYAPLLGLVALAACNSINSPVSTTPSYATFRSQGDSLAIADTLGAFRAALGGLLNAPNTPPADSGRREINWDGAPAALTNVDTFPAAFFNVNSKRGAVFLTPGTGLRVDSTEFGATAQFKAFSPKKLFAAVGSNQVTVDFQLVGTTTSGLVKGFGVVFTDVDVAGSTRVEFFDSTGTRIADLEAPAKNGAREFSFIGAVFASPVIARVVITSGDAALNGAATDVSTGGTKDLVAMDDFVYGEPQPRQ